MSYNNRRRFRQSGVFQDIYHRTGEQEETLGALQQYDRSTKWFNFGETGNPVFLNSWLNFDTTNYGFARYMRDAAGIVHLQGLLKNAFAVSAFDMFTLPPGFRPGMSLLNTTMTLTGGVLVLTELHIRTNGTIAPVYAGGGTVTYLTIHNIQFPAEL